MSAHACYWNPDYRRTEAQWCSTLAKPGWLAMIFVDWNSFRVAAEDDHPWEECTDRAFVANRTYSDDKGRRRSDDQPDRIMLDRGYVELVRDAAYRLGQPEAMNPTAGYRPHPGRPLRIYCIDRGYAVAELASAEISALSGGR